ncbi:hypothetical protein RND81_09G067600 [Saponaria officinalis]|uniref:Uncharacterized protein n=1 Tax=Saponaria officinalis TaxID=3572 RepID=A0AAW1IJ71_SAPOF
MSVEKDATTKMEVDKLLEARFIEICEYSGWLADIVMVKRTSGVWQMCVDVTNLNKVYPNVCYPLPRIDQLVDSTSRHSTLSVFGCLLKVPPSIYMGDRLAKVCIHHQPQCVQVQDDIIRPEECRGNLSTTS